MTLKLRLFALLVGLVTLPCTALAFTQPDGTMVITGPLKPSADGKVLPADGDTITVFNVGTGATEATATYGSGTYGVIITKPAAFNGTKIGFRLTQANTTYKLLFATGGEAIMQFNGSFLPVQTQLTLVISGTGTAITPPGGTTPPPGGTTPPPGGTGGITTLTGDVNADKQVDEADIQLLKKAISGDVEINKSRMDVNTDGVVNTRDLIDLIRAIRTQSQSVLIPVSIRPAPASIRP